MRFGTDNLKQVLLGSFSWWWVADVFYDGVRILQDCPVAGVTYTDDDSGQIQTYGSLTIAYQDDFAQKVAPSEVGDVLSPFGTILALSVMVQAGPGFMERIPMGQFPISEVPSIITEGWVFNETAVVTKGDLLQVAFTDLFGPVADDKFDVPGAPADLSSVWNEVQRLTGLPITRTVTDGPISSTVAYQESKLQAVYDLATVLDASPCVTPDGTVSMRPKAWPDPIATIQGGDAGELVTVVRGMSNASVRNKLVVRSYAGNGEAVLASGEITDGPLRTQNRDGSLSPYRSRPQFYSSPFIDNATQAQDYITANLPRISSLRAAKVAVTETFNPLRELGDVVTVKRAVQSGNSDTVYESFVGRITGIQRSSAENGMTQTTTVSVGQ